MSGADEGDAMDTRELKVSIPERGGADDRADSPEQSGLSTPKEYSEYQSGSKRLRTKDGWEEGEPGAGPGATDDAPGASARLHVAKPEEIRQLQERTKSACAQLADVIVALRREREWTEAKEANTQRERELRLLLRSIERRLDLLEPTPALDALRAYVRFATERSRRPASLGDLLDDELQLVLSKVAQAVGSPKQILALSAVSRRFRKLVRQPAVWRHLDMTAHGAYLTDRLLLSVVRDDGAFSLLRSVELVDCPRVTDKAVRKLLSVCGATLEHLNLGGCALVKTSTIAFAATACPNLVRLDVAECPLVDTCEALRLTDTHWPRLEEIDVSGTSRLAGRVKQEAFLELVAMVEERRARHAANREAERRRRQSERENARLCAFLRADADGAAGMDGDGAAASTHDRNAAGTAPANAAEEEEEEAEEEAAGENGEAAACACGPAVRMVDLPRFVATCKRRLDAWAEGHPVAACDHAMVMQGGMMEQPYALNMLPGCGHVLCVDCEQKSRVNMVRRHGDGEYVYPCPLCGHDMPNPGGFEITIQQ